jgi:FdhD protein
MLALRSDGRTLELPDSLVTEEPLELRVAGPGADPETLSVTMRTPGQDFELAAGYLLSEGVIAGPQDLSAIRYCELPSDGVQAYNIVTVRLSRPVDLEGVRRRTTTTASCGVCGTTSLDQLERRCPPLEPGRLRLRRSVLVGLPDALRTAQPVFDRTGGLHAAGLFSFEGVAQEVREDVGRHNAVDKLIGAKLLAGDLPLSSSVLVLSGRVSFELVQKAAVAGVTVVCAVSAPSSLAVDTARRLGVTLAGFVRGGGANVYAHPERIDTAG